MNFHDYCIIRATIHTEDMMKHNQQSDIFDVSYSDNGSHRGSLQGSLQGSLRGKF